MFMKLYDIPLLGICMELYEIDILWNFRSINLNHLLKDIIIMIYFIIYIIF